MRRAQRLVGGAAQGEDLALDGAHRRPRVRRAATRRCPDHQPAASTVWPARSSRPSAVRTPREPIAVDDRLGGLAPGDQLAARALERRDQRRDQRARVDLALVARVDARRRPRSAKPGLELAALARAQPLRVEPERALQLVAAAQLLRLVAVERDVERAAAPVADGGARGLLELGGEVRIERAPTRG